MVIIITNIPSRTPDFDHAKQYIEGGCLSTDEKPVDCAVGSIMVEVDTGKVFFFNGTTWVEQFSFQG